MDPSKSAGFGFESRGAHSVTEGRTRTAEHPGFVTECHLRRRPSAPDISSLVEASKSWVAPVPSPAGHSKQWSAGGVKGTDEREFAVVDDARRRRARRLNGVDEWQCGAHRTTPLLAGLDAGSERRRALDVD